MDVNVTWVILVHLIPIPFSITYVLIIHGHVDRTIHKIRASFKDPNSSKTLNMINTSLNEVTNIMRRNIDEILQRGENLEGRLECLRCLFDNRYWPHG